MQEENLCRPRLILTPVKAWWRATTASVLWTQPVPMWVALDRDLANRRHWRTWSSSKYASSRRTFGKTELKCEFCGTFCWFVKVHCQVGITFLVLLLCWYLKNPTPTVADVAICRPLIYKSSLQFAWKMGQLNASCMWVPRMLCFVYVTGLTRSPRRQFSIYKNKDFLAIGLMMLLNFFITTIVLIRSVIVTDVSLNLLWYESFVPDSFTWGAV